jgi:hypothetical protein
MLQRERVVDEPEPEPAPEPAPGGSGSGTGAARARSIPARVRARMKRLALLLFLATQLLAQKKALTLEALYDPKNAIRFSGAIQRGFEWIDDTTFVWPRTDADGKVVEWRIFDVATGKERPLFDKQKLQRRRSKRRVSTRTP